MNSIGLTGAALSAFQSGEFSDLIIKCNEREFKVHKLILCPQSAFFAKAVKKDAFEEGTTGIISMDHDEPDAISAMIKYLYTGDYNTETNTIDMQSHLKVYTLADKLDIPALKTVAEDKFKAGTEVDWKDATFPACVKTVYEITPPGPGGKRLRSITAIIAGKHAKEFFKLSTAFHKMMTEVAEFGADLAQVLCGSYVELIAAVPGPTSPDRWGRVWCYRCHEYWFPNRLTGECTNRCGSQIV